MCEQSEAHEVNTPRLVDKARPQEADYHAARTDDEQLGRTLQLDRAAIAQWILQALQESRRSFGYPDDFRVRR
jgi:hypothetical protein